MLAMKRYRQAVSNKSAAILLALGILQIGTILTGAEAASIPTPAPGTPALIAAPTPNPNPYNFVAGTLASSAQVNTNFWTLWNFVDNQLLANLNSCAWAPGASITSLTVTAPIGATLSACNPGFGEQLTLALQHGDYDDLTNAQTITGAKTFSAALTANNLVNLNGTTTITGATNMNGLFNTIGNVASSAGVLSVPGTGILYLNLASGGPTAIGNGAGGATGTQFNTNGTATVAGALSVPGGILGAPSITLTGAGSYIQRNGFNTYPFDAQSNSYTNHIERGSATLAGGAGQTYTFNFNTAYQVLPNCAVGYNYNGALPNTWQPISFNKTTTAVKIFGQGAANVDFICEGY